jgi:hypothetical protein
MPNSHAETSHDTRTTSTTDRRIATSNQNGKEEMGITEVAADDAVPGGPVVLVELLLDVLRDVLLHGVLLERLRRKQTSKFPHTPNPSARTGPNPMNKGGKGRGITTREISNASFCISSFMSALLSWILCTVGEAAAAEAGDGEPRAAVAEAAMGLRSASAGDRAAA